MEVLPGRQYTDLKYVRAEIDPSASALGRRRVGTEQEKCVYNPLTRAGALQDHCRTVDSSCGVVNLCSNYKAVSNMMPVWALQDLGWYCPLLKLILGVLSFVTWYLAVQSESTLCISQGHHCRTTKHVNKAARMGARKTALPCSYVIFPAQETELVCRSFFQHFGKIHPACSYRRERISELVL